MKRLVAFAAGAAIAVAMTLAATSVTSRAAGSEPRRVGIQGGQEPELVTRSGHSLRQRQPVGPVAALVTLLVRQLTEQMEAKPADRALLGGN
jgi:hypothetical protein